MILPNSGEAKNPKMVAAICFKSTKQNKTID